MRRPGPFPRALHAAITLCLALGQGGGCVDTSLPSLSPPGGHGRTQAARCAAEALDDFPPEELRVHLIDVGQGDAIWVQTPYFDDRLAESRNVLIDAGPSGAISGTSPGGEVVVAYLLASGLIPGDPIHALVLTHAHEDHYGGAEAVGATFEVGAYVDPGFTAGATAFIATRQHFEDAVRRLGGEVATPAIPALAPDLFAPVGLFGPHVEALLLWSAELPPGGSAARPSGTDVNNTSVAFALRWAGRQVLLLGDLEQRAEDALIAAHDAGEIDLSAAVLKVAHHGSDSATSDAFLTRAFPRREAERWAVISSGRRTFSGRTLPAEATLSRLEAALLPGHILSTEHDDAAKAPGTEHNDDHILIRVHRDGLVEACYVP